MNTGFHGRSAASATWRLRVTRSGGHGHPVARCTVERLMRQAGLTGVVRGKKIGTTIADTGHERAQDLVQRAFTAQAPNRCWVADFTHIATFAGVVYVAFVVDVYSRAIVGWSAATTKHTTLVLDALDMGLWRRDRDDRPVETGLIHHSDAQYTSRAFAEACTAAGVRQSMSAVGSSADDAAAESFNATFKRETLQSRRAFTNEREARPTAFRWLHRYNSIRRHSRLEQQPPITYEKNAQPAPATLAPAA